MNGELDEGLGVICGKNEAATAPPIQFEICVTLSIFFSDMWANNVQLCLNIRPNDTQELGIQSPKG